MKKLFIHIFVFNWLLLFALTSNTAGARIEINGYSNDFESDEFLLTDDNGNLLESASDSFWGENNDVRQIKLTWDEEFLYIAVDATCWGNNVIFFIDIYDDYGINDMDDLNSWARAFKFYNFNPDFFVATWDTNTDPQFWKVDENSNTEVTEFEITDAASFDSGEKNRALEAKIPFSSLYYSSYRNMADYPNLKICALITSGSDNKSGPDVAPDNLSGMSDQADRTLVIDNYISINIDEDNNGIADLGVSPKQKRTFYKTPPFKENPLKISEIVFTNGKTFAPLKNQTLNFYMVSNRNYQNLPSGTKSLFKADIYSVSGKYINDATYIGTDNNRFNFMWDGKSKGGKVVPFGIYILRFSSDTGEISENKAVVVIK